MPRGRHAQSNLSHEMPSHLEKSFAWASRLSQVRAVFFVASVRRRSRSSARMRKQCKDRVPNQSSRQTPASSTRGPGRRESSVTVTLENVRGIKNLKFKSPPPGLWLITGSNGCGKSSLFAALYRLRERNAFRKLYQSGGLNEIDNFQK